MSIERNEKIRFHERGTLDAVTRWIALHHDGIAEWFKNVRRQYQADRANVAEELRCAVLLLSDERGGRPARIGVLDVGGATLEDVTAWSTWDDPEASHRGSGLTEEQTQGNGGKAYMYRLFTGTARIVGVRDRRRNCKGFEGSLGSVERGTPGWIPTVAEGREVEISSLEAELRAALEPYGISARELPPRVSAAIKARQAFTIVEGEQPTDLYKGRIDVDDLLAKVVRHEQSTLCFEQVDFYAIHNGRILNEGKKLVLPPITPYSGMDSPFVYEIPDQLPAENGQCVSTTEGGTRPKGRLTLHTSSENMPNAWKNLRPRWQVIYRTEHQMIGAKPVSDIVGPVPGAQYVYGSIELSALEPAYVEHGRRRPKPGPLVEAVDGYAAEHIRKIAHLISARRQAKLDEHSLDEVLEENRKLDEFKNRFLPSFGDGGGGRGIDGLGPSGSGGGGGVAERGTVPEAIDYLEPETGIQIGSGVHTSLRLLLELRVRDANGRPVRATLEWFSSDERVATVSRDGTLSAREKGNCDVWVRVKGTRIESTRISVTVWNVDHVLLTPRTIDIRLGTRQQVVAEVTDDDGNRSTDVLLEWRHDSEDPLLVLVNYRGVVTANRLGRTAVTAGAGGVWARIPVEVNVIPNPDKLKRGNGFPRLLLTGRDSDPATGTIREGDPDQAPVWQEASDYVHNVWWLNLQNPEVAFAFHQRTENAIIWRGYHAERVIDMVVQVWMNEDFTKKGESQRPDYWAAHLGAWDRQRVRIAQQMWKFLETYIMGVGVLDAEQISETTT
jgi:hypothetical protein